MSILHGKRSACYDKEAMKKIHSLRKTHIIRISDRDAEEFCRVTAELGFSVSLASTADRRRSVNAASLPDVLSLDLTRNLVISYRGSDHGYEAFLEKFIV